MYSLSFKKLIMRTMQFDPGNTAPLLRTQLVLWWCWNIPAAQNKELLAELDLSMACLTVKDLKVM
jgi:hypothetical protein